MNFEELVALCHNTHQQLMPRFYLQFRADVLRAPISETLSRKSLSRSPEKCETASAPAIAGLGPPLFFATLILNPSNSMGLESRPNMILNHDAYDPGFNSIEFEGIRNGAKELFAADAIAERCRIMIPQGSQKVAGVSQPRSSVDHRNLVIGAPTPAGVAQRGATPAGVGRKEALVSGGLRRVAPTTHRLPSAIPAGSAVRENVCRAGRIENGKLKMENAQ